MTTTRAARLRLAGVATASAMACAAVLAGCSGSDGSSDQAETSASTSPSASAVAELRAFLPDQAAFGEGFVSSPVSAEQLDSTLTQVRDKSESQVVEPAQCKVTLDLTGGLDPAATAMVAAAKQDQGTKIGVIVSRNDSSLDAIRSHLDACGTVTVHVDDTVADVTTASFEPAGTTGERPLGLTRTQTLDGTGQVTTIVTAEEVDGVAIRVMVHQPSTKALPPEVLDHFQQKATTLLNQTADRVRAG